LAKANLGGIIVTFILIILGLALTPTVADSAAAATGGNVTGVAATMVGLIPMFWVIIILSVGVAAVYAQFKGMG